MAVLNTGLATPSTGDFTIDYSCRFNDDDSAYLSKTPAGAGNLRTWTWSGWIKRGNLVSNTSLFGKAYGTGDWGQILIESDKLELRHYADGGYNITMITTQLFRDVGAWYHIVVAVDTEQGVEANRVKIYVNGSQVTAFDTATYPTEDMDTIINSAGLHQIGRQGSLDRYWDGYLAEVHHIDGTQLTPSSFGETGDYGEWKPIEVTGLTYGTNGFYLDFSDSAALGDDAANSNDFTVNNLVASDQMLDTPTNNFCTLNSIDSYFDTMAEGNLEITHGADWKGARGTLATSTGKWYYEVHLDTATTYQLCGIFDIEGENGGKLQDEANWRSYRSDGSTQSGGGVDANTSLANNSSDDILQVAYDLDAGKIWFGINNSWIVSGDPAAGSNEIYSSLSGTFAPAIASYSSTMCVNFGQDSSFVGNKTAQGNQDGNSIGDFYYTPPSGFLALCTSNLPDVAVTPSEHFNTVEWEGDSDTSRAITGVGFQPDFVWIKQTNGTCDHRCFDAVRGAQYTLRPNTTAVEVDDSQMGSFDSDGFELGNDTCVNYPSRNFVAWNWLAGNETLGTGDFTQGNLASTCSRNVDAGFSIVSYEGNGTDNTTVGHGLSKAPEMVHVKARESGYNWASYHKGLHATTPELYSGYLNLSNAFGETDDWSDDAFTSTTFAISAGASVNQNTKDFIAYCWHSVEGYSKVGSYTGNGSTDGTFVYTGFRPAYILTKETSNSSSWDIHDNKRDTYNVADASLYAEDTSAEETVVIMDILSNGFKFRSTNGDRNQDGASYIYIAFAETPFKYSNAR